MHYFRRNVEVVAPTDFASWWRTKVPCYQDGCGGIRYENRSNDKANKKSITKGYKAMAEVYPNKYTCHIYDCGTSGFVVTRKVNKVVNHHIKEVVERKTYKSRPKHILKGGTLSALHVYIISYDARCYDKWEHGGFPGESDEFSEGGW